MKLFTKNNIFVVCAVLVCVTLCVLAPKGDNNIFKCGDGTSIKELNEQKKANMCLNVSANQTTEQSLAQATLIGGYTNQINKFTFGGNIVGCVSTEFGVCTPVNFVWASYAFNNNSALEYRAGNFKRTMLTSTGLDPQFANYTIILGEGASASNAMQVGYNIGKTKIFVGHQGGSSFYKFNDGYWFTGLETTVANCISLAGGIDVCSNAPVTGYAAARFTKDNNHIDFTANKLGTENQNVVLTYNRNNIAVGKCNMNVALSAWAQKAVKGIHTVYGFNFGKSTLYAEVGAKFVQTMFKPYVGIGTSVTL